MAVFAGAFTALNPLRRHVASSYCISEARNREEAVGIGLRNAHDKYPPAEGWVNHQADMEEIPRELLYTLYQSARTRDEIES